MSELYHYGVKGMKWGVRKDNTTIRSRRLRKSSAKSRGEAENLRKAGYEKEADAVDRIANRKDEKASLLETRKISKEGYRHGKAMDRSASASYTYRNRSLLSDDELRSRINRINMESQLKSLGQPAAMKWITPGYDSLQRGISKYGAQVLVAETVGPEAAKYMKPKK